MSSRITRISAVLCGLAIWGSPLWVSPARGQLKLATGPVEAPYSLTAADGTGLRLVELGARAVVDGPLAFTELHLTFENPQPRVIEGHFKVTMPDGAAISRFAMKIRGQWMEGEVVEKQAARRAYEDALHRRQDPALLEQDAGNNFRARVFPIPAGGRKELIISWSHELTVAGEAYRLPLLGLPRIERLELTAMTSAASAAGPKTSLGSTTSRYTVSRVDQRDFTPDRDWIVFADAVAEGGDGLRQGNLAVARFVVPGADVRQHIADAVLMVDTSASRAIDFERRIEGIAALVARLPTIGVERLQVVAFDQGHAQIYEGPPSGFASKGVAALRQRAAMGASSLTAALESLEVAPVSSGAARRVIFFTDGMLTAGETDLEKIGKRIAALRSKGVVRVDAVVDTTARDPLVLAALVQGDLPSPGKVIEARAGVDAQLDRLGRATLGDVTLTVPGAEWVWPSKIRGLQGGDLVVAFADLPAVDRLSVHLSGGVESTVEPTVRDAERPLIERAWVAARIDRLLAQQTHSDPDLKAGLKHQIIALSTRHRVLSPYTALVVLENENEYRRFGIDRRALAEILVVGPTGIELMRREALAVAPQPPPPPPRPQVRRRRAPAKSMARRASPADEVETGAAAPGIEGGADAVKEEAEALDMDMDMDMDMELEKKSAADDAPMEAMAEVAAAPPPAMPAAAPEPEMAEMADDFGGEAEPEPMALERRAAEARAPARRRARRTRPPSRPPARDRERRSDSDGRRALREIEGGKAALTGEMAEIDADLKRGRVDRALAAARRWRQRDPADLLAAVALGRALAASGAVADASRAYGSLIDLYPSRADMRRFAGNALEALGEPGLALAVDSFTVAKNQRPDHPSVYHMLGMALLRAGRYAEALDVVLEGIGARRVRDRFAAVERILQEDAQLIAAAWLAAEPGQRDAIEGRLRGHGLRVDDARTLRFVLTWETDANDVDFHIFDKAYNHAYYSSRSLATGGELYADITSGYGPECFTIFDPRHFPYRLKAHYYSRGPMGYGSGNLQIIRHDGRGGIGIEDRPFVIMQDQAYVDLGSVDAKIAMPSKPRRQ